MLASSNCVAKGISHHTEGKQAVGVLVAGRYLFSPSVSLSRVCVCVLEFVSGRVCVCVFCF